jgi:hypothetical protein
LRKLTAAGLTTMIAAGTIAFGTGAANASVTPKTTYVVSTYTILNQSGYESAPW